MTFVIRLLADDKDSIEVSRKEIIQRAIRFVVRMLDKNTCGIGSQPSGMDLEEALLARDILNGRFWGTLDKVDGRKYVLSQYPFASVESKEQVAEKNVKARSWANQHFHKFELEEILNIAVNQAVLRPYHTAWPGTRRGHSILYQDLVEKEGSMFSEAVTDQFRKRLNNGRFWEELPYVQVGINRGLGIRVVRDVLENHYDDLNVGFAASHGLELMRFSADDRKIISLDLKYLGEAALERYAQFLARIDEEWKVQPGIIEELLRPYLSNVLGWDADSEGPYYDGEKDIDEIQRGRFQDKLKVPIVQKYVDQFPEIREHIAKILAEGTTWCSNGYGQQSRFVKEVLGQLPNQREVVDLMLKHLQSDKALRFFQESEKHDQSLYHLLPWNRPDPAQLN